MFRPSSDAVLDIECEARFTHYSISIDLLRVAASKVVPELGEAPVDVAFALGAGRFGDWRITVPVAASAAQRAFERCPREDPGHTVACPFAWQGSVTLDRLTPAIGPARQTRGGAVQVDVRCAVACAPVLRAGAARKTFRVPAGVTRRLTLPARAARVVVTIGDERKALKVGRGR